MFKMWYVVVYLTTMAEPGEVYYPVRYETEMECIEESIKYVQEFNEKWKNKMMIEKWRCRNV